MNLDTVDELRFYSRELIRELGFLNENAQNDELNVAQIHVLLECERYGIIEQQLLVNNLRVNKSYVSRLIKSLIHLDYVTFYEVDENKKNKPIRLTHLGLMKVKEINEQARTNVASALHYLTPEEHKTVSEGLRGYSHALKKSRTLQGVVIRPIEKKDNESLCVLIKAVLSEFGANKPGFASMDEETHSMYEFYQEQGQRYYVAVKDHRLLGGIGFAPLHGASPDVCELRKMYLDKGSRGLGLGNELLRRVMHDATSSYKAMYLETLSQMTQAISLYRKAGFEFLTQAMGDTGHYGCDTWMLKQLVLD
ncbi:MAG: helix-turn-helix domain-containing GNAT family N-acetyltransferase [Legionella sp.]|uniref:bifunctional helix-turn-helix transcriptional regulator/GNAT family N-acetyltransferase n=1 Tax=Legionella sp. TaxID=459 RepID=UPI0039E43863